MQPVAARRGHLAAVIDLLAITLVAVSLLILAGRVWAGLTSAGAAVAALAMCAAGYLAADLLTGFIHWFCDTFFEETTPMIGASLICSFREHHRDPLLMTHHGFLELTGSSFRGLAPMLVGYVLGAGTAGVAANAFVLTLAGGSAATNLFHRWAHEPCAPPAVRWLQRSGLVLTPERHARHHRPPYGAAYCVTSGWLNPWCERFRLWSRAETTLSALGFPVTRDHD